MMKWGSLAVILGFPLSFASATIQSNICQIPTQPIVTTPVDGSVVSSPNIMVSGTTTDTSTVAITDNGQHVASVSTDATGAFQVQISLVDGNNTIGAQTSNPCGISSTAMVHVMANLPTPPPSGLSQPGAPTGNGPGTGGNTSSGSGSEGGATSKTPSSSKGEKPQGQESLVIDMVSPADGFTTSNPSVLVRGATNIPATETITNNGHQVVKLDILSRSFGALVPLEKGKNTLIVTAKDESGQVAKVQLHVTRGTATSLLKQQPWYKTVPGRVAVITGSVAVFVGGAGGVIALKRGRQ